MSQQLFAASMLLSALTESDENATSLKQVEKNSTTSTARNACVTVTLTPCCTPQ
ncbi:hypothetical protein OL548_13445 [Lysinibacillus sp. MHQ-1]|nr:hypothetical protein OL548_13445 [Lysinibacillus sp. MHQ-1]